MYSLCPWIIAVVPSPHIVTRHHLPDDELIVVMPSWFNRVAQQTRTRDKATSTTFHSPTLHLLVENVFSFLCIATLCLYFHYALIAHLSIKLRGLVQNDW